MPSSITLNMYLARNKRLHWLIRQSRDLYKKPPSRAEESPKAETRQEPVHEPARDASAPDSKKPMVQPETFPYKFGGIKDYGTDHPNLDLFLPKQRPFYDLYISLLQAIVHRDAKKIEKIVEPSLLGPLMTAPNCSLINGQTSGKTLYHQFSMGIGTTFVRAKGPFRKQSTPDNLVSMYIPESFSPSPFLFSSQGIPILLSVNATIISKARLGEQGKGELEREEAHSITFECETKFLMKKMMDLMGMLPSMGLPSMGLPSMGLPSMGSTPYKDLLKKLIYESSPQWRVGNIDKFLPERYQ